VVLGVQPFFVLQKRPLSVCVVFFFSGVVFLLPCVKFLCGLFLVLADSNDNEGPRC